MALPPLVAIKVTELARLHGTLLGFDYTVALDTSPSPRRVRPDPGRGLRYSGPPATCNGPDGMPAAPVTVVRWCWSWAHQSPSNGYVDRPGAAGAGRRLAVGLLCIDPPSCRAGLDLTAGLAGLIPGLAAGTAVAWR